MLRRYDCWLAGLVFAVFAAMALHVARAMPVFSLLDEVQHFDYAVKLARGKQPNVADRLEPEVLALWQAGDAHARQVYLSQAPITVDPATPSYQAYHPSLPYRLAALLPGVEQGEARGLMLLRVLCVGMVVAARVLTYMALRRVSPVLALAGLAYLGLMLPVDMLRFSNDAPAMLLGALTFLLFVRHATAVDRRGKHGPERRRLAGIALALLATCMMKITGVLFVIPAVALGFAGWAWARWAGFGAGAASGRLASGERIPRELKQGALVLLPALLFTGVWIAGNVQRDGTVTGTAHLKALNFVPPVGLSWNRVVPMPHGWSYQHQLLLQTETRIWGMRSGEKVLPFAAGVAEIGWVLAWGFAAFGFATPRGSRLELVPGTTAVFLRGQVPAATLLMLLVLATTSWMVFAQGGVNWAGRQFIVIEGALLLPLAAGWAWLMAGAGRAWGLARIVVWIGAAGVFFALGRHYLKF